MLYVLEDWNIDSDDYMWAGTTNDKSMAEDWTERYAARMLAMFGCAAVRLIEVSSFDEYNRIVEARRKCIPDEINPCFKIILDFNYTTVNKEQG